MRNERSFCVHKCNGKCIHRRTNALDHSECRPIASPQLLFKRYREKSVNCHGILFVCSCCFLLSFDWRCFGCCWCCSCCHLLNDFETDFIRYLFSKSNNPNKMQCLIQFFIIIFFRFRGCFHFIFRFRIHWPHLHYAIPSYPRGSWMDHNTIICWSSSTPRSEIAASLLSSQIFIF